MASSFDGPPHVVSETNNFRTTTGEKTVKTQTKMTVWYHLSTIFNQRYALRKAGLLLLCVALTTTILLSVASYAAPGINKTLSFQGRLLSSSGNVVPDGHYNIQFKIYQDGSGTTAGNPGGTLKWTETYINDNNNEGIEIKNGYFSVNLGSVNPF